MCTRLNMYLRNLKKKKFLPIDPLLSIAELTSNERKKKKEENPLCTDEQTY